MSPAVGFFLSWCHISIVHSTINQPTVVLWYVERPTLLTHQGPLAVPIHFWFWKRRIRSSSWNLILKENELLETAVHSLLRLEGRRCRQLPAVSLLPANLQCPSMTIHGFVDSGCCDIAFIQCRQPVHLPRKHQRFIKKVKIWLRGWTLAASSSYGVGTDNLHCFLRTQWPSASN